MSPKVRTFLETNSVSEHELHLLSITIEDLARENTHIANLWVSGADPTTNGILGPNGHELASSMRWRTSNQERSKP